MSKIQTITCKCGFVFAASAVPHCYEDAEWQKNMRKYIKEGCTVDLINSEAFNGIEQCTCGELERKKKAAAEPTLFD